MKLCNCGCGKEITNEKNSFIFGHSNRGRKDLYLKRARNFKEKYGVEAPMQLKEFQDKRIQTNKERYGGPAPIYSKEVKEKTKQTNLEHCGFENPMQSEKVKEKYRKTCLKKLGVDNSFKSDEIKEKIKYACLEKYGVEHPMKLTEIKEKIKQTCLEHFGVEHPMQSKEVQEKAQQTCLKNYGVENPFQSEEIQNQIKQLSLEHYGVEYPMQSKEIKEKIKQTCQEKYNEDSWMKTPQGREGSRINFIRTIENQKLNGEPLSPRIGIQERLFLNELQKYTNHNIIRNDSSFRYIVGRFPDGHIPELKLFIQFDERIHFIDSDMIIYKQDDIDCTLQLASLGYVVFRVSEKQWKDNPEKIINDFKEFLVV